MPTLAKHDDVFVLRFAEPADPAEAPDNVFSLNFLEEFEAALDQLEAAEGAAALVTTGAGKFYSNGLDVEYAFSSEDSLAPYIDRVHRLYARLLRLPMPTVAAINGHAFGAGAMLTLCHDHRVMRSDRGFWCLPEAARAMPFPPGMNALVTQTLSASTARTAMLTSHRYGAEEAMTAGIVDAMAPEDSVLTTAVEHAAALAGFDGTNLAGIRMQLRASVLTALDQPMQ